MQDGEKDEILTAEEAAEYLKMALSTLYRFMRSGQVPCFKLGNQWRFKKSVLDEWMERMSMIDIGVRLGTVDVECRSTLPHIECRSTLPHIECRSTLPHIECGSTLPHIECRSTLPHIERGSTLPRKEAIAMVKRGKGIIDLDLGLGGIFKGIGNLIDLAVELAEKAPDEVTKEGQIGDDKGLKAVYGFSVKVGGGGRPTVQQFGNIREEASGPVVDEVREPMVDTFDEGEFIRVVAEMPGISESDVKYEVKGDILIISGETGDRKYYKESLLPASVDEGRISCSSRNGIVEIKLWKTKQ